MTLDTLLSSLSQAQSLMDLDLLLDDKSLVGILNSWLFDCQQSNYSRKTIEHYQDKISVFLKFLGDKCTKPEDVKPLYITLFLTSYRKGHKASTEHGFYRAIHTYFAYMVERNIIPNHPMEKMKPPKVPRTVIQPYTEEEIKRMLEYCNKSYRFCHSFTSIRNKAILLIYISSGLRRSEMAGITLDKVNIRDRTIEVMGKGGKERFVRFGVLASKALMEYFTVRQQIVKNKCPYLWLSEEGNHLGYDGIGSAIYDLKAKAGVVKKSSTHALRHSFATQSLRNGARPDDVQRLMGHESPQMTQRYQRTVTSEDSVKQHPTFDPVDHWGLK